MQLKARVLFYDPELTRGFVTLFWVCMKHDVAIRYTSFKTLDGAAPICGECMKESN